MKIIILIIILFVSHSVYAQKAINSYKESLSVGVSTGFSTFSGNNFIAKSYNSNIPLTFYLQFPVYSNIGVGFLYQDSRSSLKSTEYVGNSSAGYFNRMGTFGCYYGKLGKRFLVMPMMGVGFLRLKNVLDNSLNLNNGSYRYKTNGTYYSVSTDLHYFLNKHVSVFTNVEYSYLDFSGVNASTQNGVSYNSANFYGVQLGVKVWTR